MSDSLGDSKFCSEKNVTKRIDEIDSQIKRFERLSIVENIDTTEIIDALKLKKQEIWKHVSNWDRVQIARHPCRPHSIDFIENIFDSFIELHGDRAYGDDPSIIIGLAVFKGKQIVLIAQEKGRETSDKLKRNFGMPHPEGYRKALRAFKLAEKFKKPVLIFIDTPGAYPGIAAEQRGQGSIIANNLFEMSRLKVPMLGIIIGEGASGGALGIGMCDSLLILENSWFSVISPEGCAAILWKNAAMASTAAEALRLNTSTLIDFNIVDEIIAEPIGGAHNDKNEIFKSVSDSIFKHLMLLLSISSRELLERRYIKYRKIGVYKNNK
jgi:acetyl-CoA carboxylase carboxyl transferase subunit alpha